MSMRNQPPAWVVLTVSRFILAVSLAMPAVSMAQSNLTIYADSLAPGWVDQSYNATRNFANPSPVHSGSHSISATLTGAWGAIQLYHPDMTDSAYSSISFWLNGGPNGGQQLQMYGNLDVGGTSTAQPGRYYLNTPPANIWQQYTVPLSALGVANATNFTGFAIQDSVGSTEPTFYVDDIQFVSSVVPAVTHITVNTGLPIRSADARWFGMNVAIWDNALGAAQTVTELTNMGMRALRFPGGSDSDDYHWLFNRQDNNTWSWTTSLADYIRIITNANAQSVITLNYGTGFTNEAAAWVAYVNATTNNPQPLGVDPAGTNWLTAGYWASLRASSPLGTDDGFNFLRISRPAPLGFKYWEIGNEVYGTWETDSNAFPHDPYHYALAARDYITLLKAVDPTIKIGVVVTPGEDSSSNFTSQGVVNLRTGQTHFGWAPVVLATLNSQGVTPDFIIHHRYPQQPGGEDDLGLLLSSSGWAFDAANLRQIINDYTGSNGANIEMVCTENNSVSSNPGKQSVSLVNALFMMDSLAELMQTEFNGLFWWNFRNGSTSTTGNMSPNLYGWRLESDYGVLEGNDFFPTYYAPRLMQKFVQPGDTVITAASDYTQLSAYAVRRQDGSLTLLAINKSQTNIMTGQVSVAGFTPASGGTVYSYGMPQDFAVLNSAGSPDIAQTNFSGAGTNFNYVFPPYSATVLALSPAPPKFQTASISPDGSQIVLQLQGQTGVPYVIQSSPDLVAWTAVSTNSSLAGTMSITNSVNPSVPAQFWRAVWQP